MRYGYRVNAYYSGEDEDHSIEFAIESLDFDFDDLDWAPDEKVWSWYLHDTDDVDLLYAQLKNIKGLTLDVLRYELLCMRLH